MIWNRVSLNSRRAGGGWEEGILWDTFDDERDVGLKVVRALTNVRQLGNVHELAPAARLRATELAQGTPDSTHYAAGSEARVVFVPLTTTPVLDELALDDASLPDRLSILARHSRLVSQAAGIEHDVKHDGIRLNAASQQQPVVEARIFVGSLGELVVQASVAADDPNFGTSRIDPDRLATLIEADRRFGLGCLARD